MNGMGLIQPVFSYKKTIIFSYKQKQEQMKKLILFAALAASVSFTSCSDSEIFEESSSNLGNDLISFSTNKASNATRSGQTITSLSKFYVTAVNEDNTQFFSNELFSFKYGEGIFKSTTSHYWPINAKLGFYAINELGSQSITNGIPSYSYESWEAETDLVAATVIAGKKTMPYPLTFHHLTSQISFTAEAMDKTEQLTYKLMSVEMQTPASGTYHFDNTSGGVGSWNIDNSDLKTYSYDDVLPMSFAQNESVNSGSVYWNILPATSETITFNVGYQVFQNGKMIADFTGENVKSCSVKTPNLVAGKRYSYNFQLTRGNDDVITFTTAITDWEEADDVTDLEPINPALTYVKYSNGTTRTYDLEGVMQSTKSSGVISPADIIDNVMEAVEVRIGNKVTEVGYKSFAGCRKLKKVEIPSSVTKLGKWAFADCLSLTDLRLSEGLQEIDELCFTYQNGFYAGAFFSHIELPSTLKRIGKCAFAGSLALEEIEIPEGVYIAQEAFSSCNNLKRVVISANCTLGSNAFRQNVQARLPNNYTNAMTSLKTVEINGKVNFDGYAVFWGCTNLSTIKYNSTELPSFESIPENYNAWSSTTASNYCGFSSLGTGTNEFLVPADATYTEEDLDYMTGVLFNPECGGFTLKKVL